VSGASPDGSPPTTTRAPLLEVGGAELLDGLRGALAYLHANEEQTNQLNVFPVPDGDTGSNMYLTLRAAVAEADAAIEPTSVSAVMDAAAHGALMGARGNSGVILSQVLRGLAHGLDGQARADAPSLAAALAEATRVADAAVMNPIEGTILTVVRDCAAAAHAAAAKSPDVRVVLARGVHEAHAAVARTIDQLPVLRDAGVVDAGGFGFAVVLSGFARAVAELDLSEPPDASGADRSGRPRVRAPGDPPEPPVAAAPLRGAAAIAEHAEPWGFCTEFVVEGPDSDVAALGAVLAPHGDSLLVVGDAPRTRVHIHTIAPDEVIAIASRYGRVGHVKVEDMSAQHRAVSERAGARARGLQAPRQPVAVVAVASGGGFQSILESLGADRIVEGGQTMNPSAEDLVRAVRDADADAVILLPNNDNIILTARQVQALADGVDVRVVPTRTLPQGISALLCWDLDHPVDAVVAQMQAAARRVRTLEITRAVRDSRLDGRKIHVGDVLALLDGELTRVGSDEGVVIQELLATLPDPPELVTVYRGQATTEQAAHLLVTALGLSHPAVAFELHDGGQPHYPYVLSLE
jgi:DAK2 domain fusion protein YloV